MKTAFNKQSIQAVAACVLTVGAFSFLTYMAWLAWHGQSASGSIVLFCATLAACCIPLWALTYRRNLRREVPTLLAGIAAAAIALSLFCLPEHFGYDLHQSAWDSLGEFAAGVALYAAWIGFMRLFIGWYFRVCQDSITLFLRASARPSHTA